MFKSEQTKDSIKAYNTYSFNYDFREKENIPSYSSLGCMHAKMGYLE